MVFSGGIILRLFRVVISRTWFGGDSVPLVEILMVKITEYLGEITSRLRFNRVGLNLRVLLLIFRLPTWWG